MGMLMQLIKPNLTTFVVVNKEKKKQRHNISTKTHQMLFSFRPANIVGELI